MPSYIEKRSGEWWVPNPVQPEENFADKWNSNPERQRKFLQWLQNVEQTLAAMTSEEDVRGILTRLETSLGQAPVNKVATSLGIPFPSERQTGTGSRRRDPGEQFIEDLGFDVAPTYTLSIDCTVKPKSGFRDGLLRLFGNRIQQLRQLDFFITECDVPEPYDIYWKTKNTGAEASGANDLRGEIAKGSHRKPEHTKYRGEHYAECYIVKDGTCIAVARHPVTIV